MIPAYAPKIPVLEDKAVIGKYILFSHRGFAERDGFEPLTPTHINMLTSHSCSLMPRTDTEPHRA